MKSRVIVSAVIEKGNLLLFGKKPEGIGPYPNTLHLIGGGVNLDDESLTDAIQREIQEEAGIKVQLLEPLSFDEDYAPDKRGEMTHYIFLVYRAKYISGSAQASDDLEKLVWVEKDKLSEVQLNKPSKKLFKKINYL